MGLLEPQHVCVWAVDGLDKQSALSWMYNERQRCLTCGTIRWVAIPVAPMDEPPHHHDPSTCVICRQEYA